MAEQGFARRMMAQRLMTEKRDDPFSGSRFFNAGSTPDQFVRELPDPVDASLAREGANLADVAYGTAATGTLFAPGAGVADVFGYAPDPFNRGEMLPSFGENISAGNYLDAGLQTLGVAGDVMMAGGAFVPPLVGVGAALKAPRAARVAGQAGDVAADVAKVDPNQQMGDALAQAQARYFETGNFEPPTAENPVSVVLPTETEPGIIAFHGSGADFDEFRLEMIGTGEGAQAYGYGLYFTDSEDIAKFYKDAVGGSGLQLPSGQRFRFTTQGDVDDLFEVLNVPFRAGLGSDPNATNMSLIEDFSKIRLGGGAVAEFRKQPFDTRERVLDAYANDISNHMIEAVEETDDPAAGVKYLRELADSDRYDVYERSKRYVPEDRAKVERAMVLEAADQLELLVNKGFKKLQTGKVYKVALSPKPDELLDYDLPLSQQPEMLKLIDDAHGDSEIILKQAGLDPATATGGQLVNALGGIAQTIEQQKAGADFLLKAGIPGIKYRASGSRGAGVTDEAAERNYVIFDDKAVKILEKYGIVGPVLVTGGAVAATQRGGDEEGSIFPDA